MPTRFEADVLVAALEARGVKASAVPSDAGAWAPNLSADVGHRVMVFEGDRETARALLDAEGLTEVADRDERDEPRLRVRGRVVLGASLRLWVSHPMFRLTTTARQPAAMADRPERQKVGGLMSVIEEANPRGKVGGSLRAAVLAAGQRWASGQRELVRLVRELDASGEWAADGEPSCAHWVAAALDIELCTAREWLRNRLSM